MNILTHRPTLRFTEARPNRSCWSLKYKRTQDSDSTYELRINHSAIEDSFTYWQWQDGDCAQLISMMDLKERIASYLEHEEGSTANDARADILCDKLLMTGATVELFDELKQYWTALTVLVNMEVTFP